MKKLNFNIPGFELKIKLNSLETCSTERKEGFVNKINALIGEIVQDQFKLVANIKDENGFKISITGIPDPDIKTYRINLDIGLFRMLYDGLYVVLSNNNIFHGLGKSFRRFDIPTLSVPNWELLDLAMANNDDVYFDTNRMYLHSFLYELCLSFIIRHEIRHIGNGHIDYLAGKLQPLFYENSKNGLDALDSQTLEMDVDSCVFVGILNGLMKFPEQRNRMPEELQDERGIFMCTLFAIQFLFYCMPSKKVGSLSEIEACSHPNAYLRYFFSFTAGLSFLQNEYPQHVDLFGTLHQDNFWTFIDNLPEQDPDRLEKIRYDHDWSMSEEGFEYANKVWNNWDNWIPKLQPYTYIKLAPKTTN